jgi:hypothetical protein
MYDLFAFLARNANKNFTKKDEIGIFDCKNEDLQILVQ